MGIRFSPSPNGIRQSTRGACVALLCIAAYTTTNAQEVKHDFRPVRVLGAQRVITEFPTKSMRDAGNVLNPSELVIGVTVGKESRAYPINMLTGPSREILNDTLGGRAIAATW